MIYGERIRLRAAEREDLPRFVGWLNDPEVVRFLLISMPMSMASEERWYEDMLKRPPSEQVLVIEAAVTPAEGGAPAWQPIGNTSFMDFSATHRSAEIGIFIGEKSFWNRGYGSEAMRLMLKTGFETLNLHRIYLRVYEHNQRGIRAYEKAGFQHEGRLRQAQYQEGRYYDVLMMSVLRDEWFAQG